MEIELYRGSRSFVAELTIDEDTGEILGDFPLDILVQRNPISTAAFVLNSKAQAEMVKTHVKLMQAKVKALENNAERAKNALRDVMKLTGTKSIKSDDGTFKAVLYPERDESVNVFDEAQLPDAYLREIPAKYEPDKALIKRAISDGFDVPGAKIDKKDRLQIS